MNITTREQFERLIYRLQTEDVLAFDTETNGLKPYQGNRLISMSFYFPKPDESYNIAFRNGTGKVELDDKFAGVDFYEMSWQGKAKKARYLDYWFTHFKENQPAEYWCNMPETWLDEIKAVWGRTGVTYVGHNVKFDLHVLNAEGFPPVHCVEDTMIHLHTLFSDWGKIRLKISPEMKAHFGYDRDTVLANRQLKWQAAYWRIPGALDGEKELETNVNNFQALLIAYIIRNAEDPMNKGVLPRLKKNEDQVSYVKRAAESVFGKINVDSKKRGLDRKAQMWMLPGTATAAYAELDTVITWKLREKVVQALEKWGNLELSRTMNDIQLEVAWEMERTGFVIDRQQAETEIKKLTPEIQRIEQVFKDHTRNEHFLVTSWQHTLPFLRQHVNANIAGTGSLILRNYADNEYVKLILKHRMLSKTVGTYLKRWLSAADENGIVRSSLNADGTATGRFSSSGDGGNLQNIPDRKGYTIKRAIVTPGDDWMFLAIDYSTLELRLATWIAEKCLGFGDEMYKLFASGTDMHAYTRDMADIRQVLFGDASDNDVLLALGYTPERNPKEYAEATATIASDLRKVAKVMNFGLLYGGGKRMLSKLLNIGLEQALELVERWNKLFPAFRRANRYYEETAQTWQPAPDGTGSYLYVTQPISNRHRKYEKYAETVWIREGKHSVVYEQRAAMQRKAWNNIVQGLGGYLCSKSALDIQRQFDHNYLRMFAQIHDALDSYIHRDYLSQIPAICDVMCNWTDIDPVLKVAWQVGQKDWQNLVALEDYKKGGKLYKAVSFDDFVQSRGYTTHELIGV